MTFFQLKVLLKLLETGNFTKTGEILNLSQSGVSHTINTLEKEIGVKLINRGKNNISLTTEGFHIIDNIKEIIYQEELLNHKVKTFSSSKEVITIGTFPSGTRWLTELLPDLTSKYPEVSFKIKEGSYNDIENWLTKDDIDLGLTPYAFGELKYCYELFTDPLLLVVSKDHPLAVKDSCSLEDIVEFPFILPSAGCEKLINNTFSNYAIKPNTIMELKETQTILELVNKNLGITILPQMALNTEISDLKLLEIIPKIYRNIYITIKPRKKSSTTIENIVSFIKVKSSKFTKRIKPY